MTAIETVMSSEWLRHFTEEEYDELLARAPIDSQSKTNRRRARREFLHRWPDLAVWCEAPLVERLIHPPAETTAYAASLLAGQRFYVCALVMTGRLPVDYPWLLVHPITNLVHSSGLALGLGPQWLDIPLKEAQRIGYDSATARRSLHHACVRVALAKGDSRWEAITAADLRRQRDEIIAMARQPDVAALRPASAAYKNALTPGARIAGPAAQALRNNELPQQSLDWLTSNYYKTALELGHCLRLPEEGPCECDLFLTCAKFLTTSDYAPRLKERLRLERTLAEDALRRGWAREAERHGATANHLNKLLNDLATQTDPGRWSNPR